MDSITQHKILVIEDNPAFSKILKLRLEANGYEIELQEDGLDGLNKAREMVPDLIISDLMLPRMNGHQICRLIKSDRTLRHIPFLMLTSRDLDEDKKTARECGANAYIIKTTRPEIVLDVIARLLKRAETSLLTL